VVAAQSNERKYQWADGEEEGYTVSDARRSGNTEKYLWRQGSQRYDGIPSNPQTGANDEST
jgi:hypothetical protein